MHHQLRNRLHAHEKNDEKLHVACMTAAFSKSINQKIVV